MSKESKDGERDKTVEERKLGSGQTFTFVAPDLSVSGISPEILQRVLSQADRPHVRWPPFRLSAFSPPGWSRLFFLFFLFRWSLRLAAFLIRGSTLHGSSSCSKENSLGDCDRPCEALSCLLFSALWLRCNQSLFVQETQSAKDFDLACFKTFPITAVTCLQVGPMSLDWLVDPFASSEFSRSSLPPEVTSGAQQRGAFPASERSRWRQDALQAPPQILQHTKGWDGCGPFLSEGMRCITWNTRGLVGSVFSRQKQRVQTQISQKTL